METLILKSNSKNDIKLLLEFAKKMGLNLSLESKEKRYERLQKLAKKIDHFETSNDVTMEEIVEEVRLTREERHENAAKNNL